jgi:hypothetical protein
MKEKRIPLIGEYNELRKVPQRKPRKKAAT